MRRVVISTGTYPGVTFAQHSGASLADNLRHPVMVAVNPWSQP
jgi:hypothetical protein